MEIERQAYIDKLKHRLGSNPIVALLGPRQVGKTTLAHMYVLQNEAAPSHPIHIFDLESPSDQTRLSNPELTLSPLKGLVILDEIQRMPELFPLLRVLADRANSPARFIILGSAEPSLLKKTSESLAGRISFIDVSGFSIDEVGDKKQNKLWWRGGFPRAYLAKDNNSARQWHEDFFRTFLEQDIPHLGIRIPATTLRRFWTMLAHYHGQIAKLAEIARSLGSSEPTARRYLDLLSGTYVVRQLPPWHENLKKRQVKSHKVFIRDSGVLHALLGITSPSELQAHPKLGASWEGFALEQILHLTGDNNAYFWATHSGAELDLLIFHQGKRLGFEFKYTDRPKTTKSMHIAIADLQLDHLYVVHPGAHSFPLTENITATPLAALLDHLRGQTFICL
ncbi:MAG: ATP-binding protein [Anaerolineales bacterium]|nr:ATP-binding protein [Anaerolineales bacterium]